MPIPRSKKGIKVIQPWQVGGAENFCGIDTGKDFDIEPAPPDEEKSEEKKEED